MGKQLKSLTAFNHTNAIRRIYVYQKSEHNDNDYIVAASEDLLI